MAGGAMSLLLRFAVCLALTFVLIVGPAGGLARQSKSASNKNADTYSVSCHDDKTTNHVTGSVSIYGKWRAYISVIVQSDCLYTTRLWIASEVGKYRLAYLMPPERENTANGMKILGWAPNSRMILV